MYKLIPSMKKTTHTIVVDDANSHVVRGRLKVFAGLQPALGHIRERNVYIVHDTEELEGESGRQTGRR